MSESKREIDQAAVERERARLEVKLQKLKSKLELTQRQIKAVEDRIADPVRSLKKAEKGQRWYQSKKGKAVTADPDQLDIERDTKAPKKSNTIL